MNLPELPPGYTWDQYSITGPKGIVWVSQVRKKIWGPFTRVVGTPKAEMVKLIGTDPLPETTNWAADVARELWNKDKA